MSVMPATIVLSIGTLVAADIPPMTGGWEKIGLVGALIVGIGALWVDARVQRERTEKRQEKLEVIIEGNSAAMTAHAETQRQSQAALHEVANLVRSCPGRRD